MKALAVLRTSPVVAIAAFAAELERLPAPSLRMHWRCHKPDTALLTTARRDCRACQSRTAGQERREEDEPVCQAAAWPCTVLVFLFGKCHVFAVSLQTLRQSSIQG